MSAYKTQFSGTDFKIDNVHTAAVYLLPIKYCVATKIFATYCLLRLPCGFKEHLNGLIIHMCQYGITGIKITSGAMGKCGFGKV